MVVASAGSRQRRERQSQRSSDAARHQLGVCRSAARQPRRKDEGGAAAVFGAWLTHLRITTNGDVTLRRSGNPCGRALHAQHAQEGNQKRARAQLAEERPRGENHVKRLRAHPSTWEEARPWPFPQRLAAPSAPHQA